jgi:hypothetical protein
MARVTPWIASSGLHLAWVLCVGLDISYSPPLDPPRELTLTTVTLQRPPQKNRSAPRPGQLTAPDTDRVETLARQWIRDGIRIVIDNVWADESEPVLKRWQAELGASVLLEAREGLLTPLPAARVTSPLRDSYWLPIEFKTVAVERAAAEWLQRKKAGQPREIVLRLDSRAPLGIVVVNLV